MESVKKKDIFPPPDIHDNLIIYIYNIIYIIYYIRL